MRQRVAEGELAVEVLLVLLRAGLERDDDVGVVALRPDERFGVGLAPVELGEHLVGRVAAARAVALHLPVAAKLLGRVEVDAHVEHLAQLRVGEGVQPLGDHEPPGREVLGRGERAVDVRVVRLHDRLALAQVAEVLREDVEVVAVRMQRRDVPLGPLLAVVPVIVVGAEVGHLVVAEHADEAAGDRRLPRPGVADDAEHDRARHQLRLPGGRETSLESRTFIWRL